MTEHLHATRNAFSITLGIVLLAGVMRLADLGERPYGLFRDEAEKGYNAWALATSGGVVEIGQGGTVRWRRLPWMIDVAGGGETSAIYQYASVPAVWIGGLNVTTTRLTAALAGTLTVALAGWVAGMAWGGWAGAAAALALAVSPWHLNFSRWAAEGIFVPMCVLLTLGGLAGLERGRRWGAPLAGAGLGWLFYSYSGAQPFVAAWSVLLIVIYWKWLSLFRRKGDGQEQDSAGPRPAGAAYLWLGAALFLVPVIPTLIVRLEPGGSSRLARIAIWNEPGATAWSVAGAFAKNYLAHFDPRFLFVNGDRQPRHNVAGGGELLILDLILVPLGIYFSWRRGGGMRWALAAAAICGPLPAAITRDGIPHALRALPMVVPLTFWAGLGLAEGCMALRDAARRGGALRPAYATGLAAIIVAGYLADGTYTRFFRKYWRLAESPAVMVAFEAGERRAWEEVAARRRAGERVFVNAYILYVPYYQAFYLKLNPQGLAREGLSAGGCVYYEPQPGNPEEPRRRMAPGDWLIDGAPAATVRLGDGRPLLTDEEAERVQEAWVWAEQKTK